MHVLVTGGYGCIGAWIAKQLLERGDRVTVYDLRPNPSRMRLIMTEEQIQQIAFVAGDVTDLATLRQTIDECGITHVLHLAGLQVPVCRENPILGGTVNVIGTLTVFEAIRQSRLPTARLVYASSAAVFGPPDRYPNRPLPDHVPLEPSTHYGVFKCCNEGNARIYYQDHGISSIGLRPWTVYGVGRDFGMTSEPTKAIKAVALGRRYHISYGGWQDLQYVEDVAATFIRCLEQPYSGAKSYNLRGHVVDLPTFHRTLAEVAPAALELVTFGERQIQIAYDLDDSALQKDLGPMPKTPLRSGIQRTFQRFHQLHREGRLDTTDLDAAPSSPTRADEP
jgi:nucleoside-diphosphate-sugar epimerase